MGKEESIKGDFRKGSGYRKFFLYKGNVNVDENRVGVEIWWVGRRYVLGYHTGNLSITPICVIGNESNCTSDKDF